jgi:hypothetical protein
MYLFRDLIYTLPLLVNLNNSDANVRARRFHKFKTEWGFAQLLSHKILNDSSSGYLMDDTCIFGVEVIVSKGPCKGECLSMINEPQRDYFTWKIDNFTALEDKDYASEEFIVEGQRWYDWCFALLYHSQLVS